MKLDIASHQGSINKPVIVFIHGLGMDKNIWINPSDSRILAGTFPLKILLNRRASQDRSGVIATLYDDLEQRDYNLITWSQQRPAGPIASVVKELHEIMKAANELSQAGIILVGHSRGGWSPESISRQREIHLSNVFLPYPPLIKGVPSRGFPAI